MNLGIDYSPVIHVEHEAYVIHLDNWRIGRIDKRAGSGRWTWRRLEHPAKLPYGADIESPESFATREEVTADLFRVTGH